VRRRLFAEVLQRERHHLLDRGGATLVHDDLHSANVLVRSGTAGFELAAVLGWDRR